MPHRRRLCPVNYARLYILDLSMNLAGAVITATAPGQRTLPLQTGVGRDGEEKSVLSIILDEAVRAGVEEICAVSTPGP